MSSTQNSPGAMSAFMRDVKSALGEVFAGAQLDPPQVVLLHVLFGSLGLLARADGIVSHDETAFVEALIAELRLGSQGSDLALESFAEGSEHRLAIDVELERFLATYPKGSNEGERLYDSVLRLAAADGHIRSEERSILEKITAGLGFPPDTLDQRLWMLAPAAE
jgi:DnaJ like chaperone protein